MKPATILSTFDGMACGALALERAHIPFTAYYASEIDKYAIKIARRIIPYTYIGLGDINGYESWVDFLPHIDILLGGSPCQGFSIAGNQLNFEDHRSKLFFVYAKIVRLFKPKYFLLENVVMKPESVKVITDALGVEPILINSSLVSAQNRERLYWTNIPGVTQPDDKGIILRDILDYPLPPASSTRLDRIRVTGRAGDINGHDLIKRVYDPDGKSPTLDTMQGGNRVPKIDMRPTKDENCDTLVRGDYRTLTIEEMEKLQTLPEGCTHGVSATQRKKMIGNGWTIDVIAHILSNLKEEYAYA